MKKLLISLLMIGFLLTGCQKEVKDDTTIRIASLKGPTSIGLLSMMNNEKSENSQYKFDIQTQADVLTAGIVSGDYDIVLLPANVASILYNKTNGKVTVIDINTLGVLYCVSGDASIQSVKDLSGKTVVTTGQGTTPEFAIRLLLEKNGVSDCELEFKSEATEVAAVLKNNSNAIAVLPQPFVTVALANNPDIKVAFSLSEKWDEASDGSRLITGVTIVRNEFLQQHKGLVDEFLKKHAQSVEVTKSDLDLVAKLAVEKEIIGAESVAKKAIPECNVVCITGEDMKKALKGYLSELYELAPQSVGGQLPSEDLYY